MCNAHWEKSITLLSGHLPPYLHHQPHWHPGVFSCKMLHLSMLFFFSSWIPESLSNLFSVQLKPQGSRGRLWRKLQTAVPSICWTFLRFDLTRWYSKRDAGLAFFLFPLSLGSLSGKVISGSCKKYWNMSHKWFISNSKKIRLVRANVHLSRINSVKSL